MADTRTLEARARSALIREWAAENGFEVEAKGRIPGGVVAAYEAATGQDADGDGPDWSQAQDTPDPLADVDSGEEDAAAAGSTGETAGPPPPADLDEARARFARQPKQPAWARDGKGSGSKSPAQPIKVTKAVIGDIEGKLTLLLAGPAAMWQMADPLCGGEFANNLDNIVRKAVPLIAQSPEAVRWFTKGTQFLLWLDLVWALQPVAQAVYAHHVAATVMLDKQGRVIPAKRLEDGRVVPEDEAPVQAPDRSAYTTQAGGHIPPVPA